jgi:acetylornithine deacetylase/succinyl-diaminopimelate desuccinylase-like protein
MKIDKQELLTNYFDFALKELKEIIKFKSYAQSPTPNAPFGQPTKEILDYVINLAKSFGFETHQDPKNRYGFFDFGQGEKTFVILCHLDVVPPGNLEK